MYAARYLSWLAVLALGLLAGHAQAQRMYRCGNAYQDRPCEGTQQGKEVRNFSGPATAVHRQASDVQCARLGEEAMKIVWARESGATREQQLAQRPQDQWTIESVYLKRGSAPEVRAAVEAECVADKERQAQAAAMAAAAARVPGGAGAAPSASAQGPSATDMARFQQRQDAEIAANQEAFKKSRCADLNRQAENLRRQERAGGSSSTMARLHELRTSLDETRRGEGC